MNPTGGKAITPFCDGITHKDPLCQFCQDSSSLIKGLEEKEAFRLNLTNRGVYICNDEGAAFVCIPGSSFGTCDSRGDWDVTLMLGFVSWTNNGTTGTPRHVVDRMYRLSDFRWPGDVCE